jgi:hypothetical protein
MSSQPPPLPINYRSPQDREPGSGGRTAAKFFGALIGGSALSAIAWIGGWNFIDKGNGAFLIGVVPGLKLAASIPLFCFRGYRAYAAGLLTSLAVGFLIFFCTCATHLKF